MIHVSSKVPHMCRMVSLLDVAAMMPCSAAGSSANDKVSLLDCLDLIDDLFGSLLGIGLGAPSGAEEATCAGRPEALPAAFAEITFSMMIQRKCTDATTHIINSDLGKWSAALAQWSQQWYANKRSPSPPFGFLSSPPFPAFSQLRSCIETRGDAVRMMRARYGNALGGVVTRSIIAEGGVGSGSGATMVQGLTAPKPEAAGTLWPSGRGEVSRASFSLTTATVAGMTDAASAMMCKERTGWQLEPRH